MSVNIGILGGGQLGRMLCEAARELPVPVEVAVYDASTEACAKEVAHTFHRGSFDDAEAISRFASQVDIVTYEFENIPYHVVEPLENAIQGSGALGILQNRMREKRFIDSLPGVKSVPHRIVDDDFSFEYPYVVKTVDSGYDGKGQYLIQDADDLVQVKKGMVAETYLPDITEYSVIMARNQKGVTTNYPVLENVHVNHILDTSCFATIDAGLAEMMFQKAKAIAEALDYIGVLTVEYFYSKGELFVNEVAPRVHNSGHITMDAANVSQFELHLMSLLGLGYPSIVVDTSWCMVNVLGQHYHSVTHTPVPGIFYDYGKHSVRHNRKVGHINGRLADIDMIKAVRER